MAKPKDKTRILVADSHETSQHVITIMLHKMGYENIFEASNKAQAEAIIKQNIRSNAGMSGLLGGAAPKEVCDLDLLILDADLAPDGGLPFLKALRTRFKPDQLCVLFTAMKGKESIFQIAGPAGANDFIVKPFSKDILSIKLEVLLGSDRPPVIKSFSLGAPAPAKKALPAPPPPKPNGEVGAAFPFAAEKPEPAAPVAQVAMPATVEPRMAAKPASAPAAASRGTGGVAFHGRRVAQGPAYTTDGPPTAELVDGHINGHYHEQVNVIGGGQNCYWARETKDGDKVRVEYLSAKGTATGMEAKVVSREQFMYTFVLCRQDNCPIMKRLAGG
ncbi:MAG: response regulator [Nitrospinae bacterium]|nr:response regulator [Nitrospinota bacterium]